MSRKTSERIMNLLLALFSIIFALIIIEITMYALVRTHNLHLLPTAYQQSIYYHIRSTIQFEPASAQYDHELGYILRKNSSSTFNNYEFSTAYQVNSMGTRDSERSLVAPEVIFIGDSYTLGWGVNQSDAFPQQFAALTGKKTLNAGISSYGTAREMLLLQRLITRDTRHIVLQYCFNDLQENRQYVDADFSLKVMSEKDYLKRSQRLRYYPGRYCVILYFHLRHNIKAAFKKNEPVATEDKTVEVQYFLRTLAHHKALLADRRLSVLVCPADKKFLATLRKELGSMKELQDLAIELIDTSEILNPNDQYVIDEHYKASGHKKIAELLAAGPSAGNAANRTAVRGK